MSYKNKTVIQILLVFAIFSLVAAQCERKPNLTPTATFTPRPSELTEADEVTATFTPRPSEVDIDPDSEPEHDSSSDTTDEQPVPEPVPDPEPDTISEAPLLVDFVDPISGITVGAYDYYNMGSSGDGFSPPELYVYVKPGVCEMRVDVKAMPTTRFPGATPLEALTNLYQQEYVELESSMTWNILIPPHELTVNGTPAARLQTERINPEDNDRKVFEITTIQGDTRSAVVEGRIGAGCADNPDSVASLTQVSDSVRLSAQDPICYVGAKPDTEPVDYEVACDGWMGNGVDVLTGSGYSNILIGPVTWDECAQYMRDQGQPGW